MFGLFFVSPWTLPNSGGVDPIALRYSELIPGRDRQITEPFPSPPVVSLNFQTTREASMRSFCAALLVVATIAPLLVVATIAPAAAYTDEQVSACTPDVMRLCSDAIPDESRITKCMIQKTKQISATCMIVMRKGPPRVSRVAAQ
jgi:hypothetical protein